jgi:hypothetical protein
MRANESDGSRRLTFELSWRQRRVTLVVSLRDFLKSLVREFNMEGIEGTRWQLPAVGALEIGSTRNFEGKSSEKLQYSINKSL